MPDAPIRFYLDFASPYAYFAASRIDAVAAEFGRNVEWRPILMWAVLKAHGIAAPMDAPVKRDYLLNDMARSAAFFGLPYRTPAKLPLSAHLAGRLFYAVRAEAPELAVPLARRLLSAFFADGLNIADEATLSNVAAEAGVPASLAKDGMKSSAARAEFEASVDEAIASGVVGSPYFLVDGQGFFGADRLPHLRWFLSGARHDRL